MPRGKRQKLITLTIDGKKIAVEPGASVMKAALSHGIDIPHFCYLEHITPLAACRLCVVEIEGNRNLIASCARPAESGMIVTTNSERVLKARRMVLDLLLSDHPTDCLTCEKNGDCRLQDYAYEYGVTRTRFDGERHNHPLDESNPFISRDFNKCIKCHRCAQVCQEVQFCNILDYQGRGFDTMVTSADNRPLPETDCVYCGRCVSVCPVGALTAKMSRGLGRAIDVRKVTTTCPYCGVGCSLELHVRKGRVIEVASSEESAVNKGSLCVKGRFGFGFINHPDRLATPLVRKGGSLKPATWDEAIRIVADRLREIKRDNGPDAIALLSSSKCTNEENYLMQKFARAVIGTNNIDNCARL